VACCAIRRSPSGPCHTAYMPAMTASRTCAVQMLLVAFSRRMCCSRVCSARRSAGRPRRPCSPRPGARAAGAGARRARPCSPRGGRRTPSGHRSAASSRRRRPAPTPPAG
jgi:hypothetical protein